MSKNYYRVLKETPLWEEGAIIENNGEGGGYRPIDSVFVKDVKGIDDSWYEGDDAVENQPDWFERVYPIGKLNKTAFGTKKQAQAAAAALYEGDKK